MVAVTVAQPQQRKDATTVVVAASSIKDIINEDDELPESEFESLLSTTMNNTNSNSKSHNLQQTKKKETNTNAADSSSSLLFFFKNKKSLTRFVILQFIVMIGCYHVGKWACEIQNSEGEYSLQQGNLKDVVTKKPNPTKEQQQDDDDDDELKYHNKAAVESKVHDNTSDNTVVTKNTQYALTYNKLKAIRKESTDLINLLNEYYSQHNGGPEHILSGTGGWAFGWDFDSWDFDESNSFEDSAREYKLVDTMARALLDVNQDKFVIGVIGSSVAAGHDNCRYDCYEEQLQRTWSNVWSKAGMTLEVQNAGQGGGCGDSHKNQVWCIQQNVSPFIDIVHYSWSYFEASGGGIIQRESLVRWTQLLSKTPPVHYVNVHKFDTCLHKHNPEDDEDMAFEYYKEFGYNAFCFRYAMSNSQHTQVRNKKGIFAGGHIGDNFHNYTRYGESESQLRQESLGVVMRNWHPGPLGFQLISDALIYVYTKAMLKALERIENIIDENSKTKNPDKPVVVAVDSSSTKVVESSWWKSRPIVLGSQMKPPLQCNPRYCHVDIAPQCKNFELPTFGYYGASIAPPDDDLNPWMIDTDNTDDNTDDKNVIPQNWTNYIMEKDWTNMVDKIDQSIYQETPEFCIFPDHCAGPRAYGPENGRIVFKLPKMEVGFVSICFCCGKKVGQPQLLDNPYVEIMFNDVLLSNRTEWELYPDSKCVKILDDDRGLQVGSTGHAYLSIRILEGNTETITISHVITL